MAKQGWKKLLAGGDFRSKGGYPIPAYSEFMPPPRLGRKPLGEVDSLLFAAGDPWGWQVTEYEEALELQPGLERLAGELLHRLQRLGRGEASPGIPLHRLGDNPCWPEILHGGAPAHERYVLLAPVALARTQDDKGRVRWTLFGGSEQGPGWAFWRGFWRSPGEERPAAEALDFLRRLLASAYGEGAPALEDLRRAGFRILPDEPETAAGAAFPTWRQGPLPSWARRYLWAPGRPLRGVRYLLTFRPFGRLPGPVQQAYRAGDLHLLPFPGSLVFWGLPRYADLARELPLAGQIPLLRAVERSENPHGIRIPQSGWLREPRPGQPEPEPGAETAHGPLRNTYQRTHRWARVERNEDELAVPGWEDKVAHVLFSAAADDLGLYGKPMARNAQLWTDGFQLLLDGPRASREELAAAARRLAEGGLFGYRFLFPAMRVGRHEVYWQRPLVAHLGDDGQAVLLPDPPLGVLTAYDLDRRDRHDRKGAIARPVELWPRLLDRAPHRAALAHLQGTATAGYHRTVLNLRKLLDAWQLLGERPLERSFARALLTVPEEESLDAWLDGLPERAAKPSEKEAARQLADEVRARLAPGRPPAGDDRPPGEPLTFGQTALRSFEESYWKTISSLATGRFLTKDNADCVLDEVTEAKLAEEGRGGRRRKRDLDALGDYLLRWHEKTIARKGMEKKAFAAALPFHWRTDFEYTWSDGWLHNQDGKLEERDVVVVIPGRDRGRAVIMADHYDTAYMEDAFGYQHGGHGPRLAAAGADDNHSATAALMLAAPIFLDLSRAGKLACDVWLVHLTGEEFPSDCLGARQLAERAVLGDLKLRTAKGRWRDVSRTRIAGVYVLDMVAHNNDRAKDVFQICPGTGRRSLILARHAHAANRLWNELAPAWNARPGRRGRGRGRRSADGKTLPVIARHPELHGEVRPVTDPHSTLYNTDGQIFSDAGIPVVLFMEDYDINRHGYHDSHDTMENIDLDYGAALAAIAIESVARAASHVEDE